MCKSGIGVTQARRRTMTEKEIYNETREFVQKIKKTDTYNRYIAVLKELENNPELQAQVDDYRMKNYEMQMSVPEDRIMEETEKFERQYEWLRANPLADRFLAAELAFCRMMQEVSAIIDEEIQGE